MSLKQRSLKILKWTGIVITSLVILVSTLLYVFQDKICNLVLVQVGKQFREPVYFSTADITFWSTFPNLSININDVKVGDAFTTIKSKNTLLKSERIRLVFNPIDLWRGNYHIKEVKIGKGELNLRTAENGEVNYRVLNESDSTENGPYQLKISAFSTEDFKLNILNKQVKQYYKTTLKDMLFSGDFNQEEFTLNASGDLRIGALQSGQITLLKDKPVSMDLSINVNTLKGTFEIPTTTLKISDIPFIASGNYGTDSMRFEVAAKELKLTEFINKFSLSAAEQEVNEYRGSGDVDFDLTISGSTAIANAPTLVNCDFKVKKGNLTEPLKKTRIKNLTIVGNYSSNGQVEKDQLIFNNLSFKTAAGPFWGKVKIINFNEPNISGSMKGALDLGMLNGIFRNEYIDRINGVAKVNADFDLKLRETLAINRMNGDMMLSKVWFKAKEDHRTFENINGKFTLNGSRFLIDGATLAVNQTDLAMSGSFGNIFNYLANKGTLEVDCKVNSHQLVIADLGKTTKQEKIESKGKTFVIPDNIKGQINLNASSITYEGHQFENVSGPIAIGSRVLNFPSLKLRNAGADINGMLQIVESTPERFEISTSLRSTNIYFAPLFKEWNNFEQGVINSSQISGRAEMEVDFYAPFNLLTGIELDQLKANAHMKVFNGHLKNVASLEDIALSLKTNSGKLLIGKKNIESFQNKLKDIAFSTLENTINIQNSVLTIPNMKIASSALNLDLSGTHTFENKIDYRINFDFRALLGDDRDSEFGTVLNDEMGLKIFLRMYGDLDNPIIEWDKTGKKQETKQQLAQEKETIKSMLKSEFGVFKKDSSVQDFTPKTESKEVVKINFNHTQKNTKTPSKPDEESTGSNKTNKLKNTLNKWKEEQNQANVSVTVKKG